MFQNYYPNEPELAARFVSLVQPGTLSMAKVQQLFLQFKDKPREVVEYVQSQQAAAVAAPAPTQG